MLSVSILVLSTDILIEVVRLRSFSMVTMADDFIFRDIGLEAALWWKLDSGLGRGLDESLRRKLFTWEEEEIRDGF